MGGVVGMVGDLGSIIEDVGSAAVDGATGYDWTPSKSIESKKFEGLPNTKRYDASDDLYRRSAFGVDSFDRRMGEEIWELSGRQRERLVELDDSIYNEGPHTASNRFHRGVGESSAPYLGDMNGVEVRFRSVATDTYIHVQEDGRLKGQLRPDGAETHKDRRSIFKLVTKDTCHWPSYLERYPDLVDAFGRDEALARRHYLRTGKKENRDCNRLKQAVRYPDYYVEAALLAFNGKYVRVRKFSSTYQYLLADSSVPVYFKIKKAAPGVDSLKHPAPGVYTNYANNTPRIPKHKDGTNLFYGDAGVASEGVHKSHCTSAGGRWIDDPLHWACDMTATSDANEISVTIEHPESGFVENPVGNMTKCKFQDDLGRNRFFEHLRHSHAPFDEDITLSVNNEAIEGDGNAYRGKQNRTRSGKTCQNWTKQAPHEHGQTLGKNGLGDHNRCRNPDGEDSIWCYTTDSAKRWEHCDPLGKSVKTSLRKHPCSGANYVAVNRTEAGWPQLWAMVSVAHEGTGPWHLFRGLIDGREGSGSILRRFTNNSGGGRTRKVECLMVNDGTDGSHPCRLTAADVSRVESGSYEFSNVSTVASTDTEVYEKAKAARANWKDPVSAGNIAAEAHAKNLDAEKDAYAKEMENALKLFKCTNEWNHASGDLVTMAKSSEMPDHLDKSVMDDVMGWCATEAFAKKSRAMFVRRGADGYRCGYAIKKPDKTSSQGDGVGCVWE